MPKRKSCEVVMNGDSYEIDNCDTENEGKPQNEMRQLKTEATVKWYVQYLSVHNTQIRKKKRESNAKSKRVLITCMLK